MNFFKFVLFAIKVGNCLGELSALDYLEDRFSHKSYCKHLAKLQAFRHNRRLMPEFSQDEMRFLDENYRKEYGDLYDILKGDVCS